MKRLPQLKEDQLIETIGNGKVVLFFTADWCPDCRFIKPAMPEIEQDFSDYTFYEVDRDENIDLAAELNVFGIPSFIVYDNGKEIGRFVNKDRKTKQQVEDFLNNLKYNKKAVKIKGLNYSAFFSFKLDFHSLLFM